MSLLCVYICVASRPAPGVQPAYPHHQSQRIISRHSQTSPLPAGGGDGGRGGGGGGGGCGGGVAKFHAQMCPYQPPVVVVGAVSPSPAADDSRGHEVRRSNTRSSACDESDLPLSAPNGLSRPQWTRPRSAFTEADIRQSREMWRQSLPACDLYEWCRSGRTDDGRLCLGRERWKRLSGKMVSCMTKMAARGGGSR